MSTTTDHHPSPDLRRSGCPVSLGLDIFGDRWTLLIVRDLMFSGKRHYREMLASAEHISSNILADRLKLLLAEGIVRRSEDPSHQQKVIYSLTEKGIALLPVLMAISAWSLQYRPVDEVYRTETPLPETQLTGTQGPLVWEQAMAQVRNAHLDPEHP